MNDEPSPPAVAPRARRQRGLLAGLAAFASVLLAIIGIRFLILPEDATRTFGLGGKPLASSLDAAIGLRDLWLAGLGLAFAWLRDWRALALWLGLGSAVCFGDAVIVIRHGISPAAVAFHVASGVFCAVVGWRCWRLALKDRSGRDGAP